MHSTYRHLLPCPLRGEGAKPESKENDCGRCTQGGHAVHSWGYVGMGHVVSLGTRQSEMSAGHGKTEGGEERLPARPGRG